MATTRTPAPPGQGETLRRYRGNRSVEEMAREMEVHPRTWQRWETEEAQITGPARRLAEILGGDAGAVREGRPPFVADENETSDHGQEPEEDGQTPNDPSLDAMRYMTQIFCGGDARLRDATVGILRVLSGLAE